MIMSMVQVGLASCKAIAACWPSSQSLLMLDCKGREEVRCNAEINAALRRICHTPELLDRGATTNPSTVSTRRREKEVSGIHVKACTFCHIFSSSVPASQPRLLAAGHQQGSLFAGIFRNQPYAPGYLTSSVPLFNQAAGFPISATTTKQRHTRTTAGENGRLWGPRT